jgi:hypothetical protein
MHPFHDVGGPPLSHLVYSGPYRSTYGPCMLIKKARPTIGPEVAEFEYMSTLEGFPPGEHFVNPGPRVLLGPRRLPYTLHHTAMKEVG